ncbi:hypothetical protein AAFF_G00065040 [Aldrovandia affinis]|uniref:Multicilin n=1 Tax=Aldrovandia affinis TaxID=143900 RepID=A0AAD7WY32_9TELE|nr:hypothetical protein AAFF_G00065040 [Aldrovandia affinis]
MQDKNPATYCEKQEYAKNARNSVPVPIYIEENISIVDEAFATIAWQDLEDCTSVLRRESDCSGQQVHGSGFGIQDFTDSAVNFLTESTSLLESSACSSGSLTLSDCNLSDYTACTITPIPSAPDDPPQVGLSHSPPVPPLPQNQLLWRSLAEHHQIALEDALEANNQLYLTLNKKQEEAACLQQRNLHLKELANQAKHLASVLNRLISPCEPPTPPGGSPVLKSATKRRRLEEQYERVPPSSEVSRILREVSEGCRAVLQQEAGDVAESVTMHGMFEGLLTSTPRRSLCLQGQEEEMEEEGTAFRTSIRDHCTIRTLTFPQGHAFTSCTPQGGYRFRWAPS